MMPSLRSVKRISEMAQIIVDHTPARSYKNRVEMDICILERNTKALGTGFPSDCWLNLGTKWNGS